MKHREWDLGGAVLRVGATSLLAACCGLFFACGGGGKQATKTTTTTTTATDTDTDKRRDPASSVDKDTTTSTPTSKTAVTKTPVPLTTVPKVRRVLPKKLRTTKSPAKMSQFLVKPAKSALKRKRFNLAIPLYQGLIVARGPGSKEGYLLARTWADQGDYDKAVQVLDAFIANTTDPGAKSKARRERTNLMRASNPFAKQLQRDRRGIRRWATLAFKRGRAAYRKKKYADAQLYFRIGAAIDPDLPGFLRELGATYNKLGMQKQKIRFYYSYLRRRPFGKNADAIRKQLRKTKGLLTRLTIKSSMKCEELWINGQKIRRVRLPMKNLLVAPGKYRGLCLNYKYSFGMFENSYVQKGKPTTLEFRWTVVVNALRKPSGRITLEDARSKTGDMRSLPLAQSAVGVVVPTNNRALRMVLTSLDRTKRVERHIKLQPGQKEVIKW